MSIESSTVAAAVLESKESGPELNPGEAALKIGEMEVKIRDTDPATRMKMAHAMGADMGSYGYVGVRPLGEILMDPDPGIAKAGDEALKRIVQYAARPGASRAERSAVAGALTELTDSKQPMKVRTEAVRLLQYIGGDAQVPALAKLLDDPAMREDARLTLERIPGNASLRALERSARSVPAEFRSHIEQTLHHRRAAARTIGIGEA